jgi:hypothetical protein
MWPEQVERVASFLRGAGVQARLEELPDGVDEPPGPNVIAAGYDCDGRMIVALHNARGTLEQRKLIRAAGCSRLSPAPAPSFPYETARVFVDRGLLAERVVWVEAGSPRHYVGVPAAQLARLTRSQTASLLRDDGLSGEVDLTPHG